ncbi:heat shock protein HtpX [Brevundimonas diminuta]|jgi:predicted Zn-dependent protease|uniref:M48 family metallopeptidase n=2 Tax=Brevundimonas TaxID=41275 RepID=A0A246KMB4_BREDI|nr:MULTISPECIES: M48 family metalloprotease [Brevundimonas]ASD25699.1 peptidase M48 [Brevundimonas diminuta]EGF94957.1 peptidase family M48 family protein [Brevundimonas diminuta ATCC 11568]MBD3573462.1 M48 family peptidase [Brevundimonas diminuta]MBD3819042.1 M48 family metallopeptidase [Brevundimonas diminuta]OMG60906.1 peptidase M48 [Brevundimonas sp. ZS04]
MTRTPPAATRFRRYLAAGVGALAVLASAAAAQAQSLIRDTEIEGIIHEWSEPVLDAMGLDPNEVEILLVNDNDLNAFATRGRIMGLNTGLILRTKSPNQLLGVIAHEAGHIKNRHTLRDGAQNAGMQPMIMTMALGALAAIAGAPDAGAALLASSQYFGTLGALRYMQSQEGEADITGARALERAGESGRGMVEFFENFRAQEIFSDQRRYPYFRSHPLSSQRIEALRRPVEAASHYDKRDSDARMAQHALVVAKIRAFMDAPNATLRDYPSSDVTLPARYARAIAWYRDGQTQKALDAVDVLLAEQPENPYFWELKGQILFEEGRPAEALGAHEKSVELKPDAPLLRINLAHALIETSDASKLTEAENQLKRALALEPENTMGWRLLSQAYASQGKEGEARLASAEYWFALRRPDQAAQFAMRARDMLDRSSIEWRRATDIVLASGATEKDITDAERRNEQRSRSGVIPPGA